MRRWHLGLVVVIAGVGALALSLDPTAASAQRPQRPSPPPPPASPPPAPTPPPPAPPPPAPTPPPPTPPPAAASCPQGYARVPGGTFWMGSPDGEGGAEEHPQHQVTVAAFCMQKTEVTVTAYAACATAGACPPAPTTVDWASISDAERTTWSAFCNAGKADRGNHPINCVDWNQSTAYCKWSGGRLPTEEEWEYAARGTDGRRYPWGNDAPLQLCWKRWTGEVKTSQGTCAVGSFLTGDSPFGLHDMAGNVWEWTSSTYCSYGSAVCSGATRRVTRGGGWRNDEPDRVRGAKRNGNGVVMSRSDGLGFRCAR